MKHFLSFGYVLLFMNVFSTTIGTVYEVRKARREKRKVDATKMCWAALKIYGLIALGLALAACVDINPELPIPRCLWTGHERGNKMHRARTERLLLAPSTLTAAMITEAFTKQPVICSGDPTL